jgi:hypothetical protein
MTRYLIERTFNEGLQISADTDAPSPEAIRRSARRNNLPIDKITEVRVLDPYFHL